MIDGMVSVIDKLPIMGENKRVLVDCRKPIDNKHYFNILADELNEEYLITLTGVTTDQYLIYIYIQHIECIYE